METANVVKNKRGTLDGSIHSAIRAIIKTAKHITGITIHRREAVYSSATQRSKKARTSMSIISNKPNLMVF